MLMRMRIQMWVWMGCKHNKAVNTDRDTNEDVFMETMCMSS